MKSYGQQFLLPGLGIILKMAKRRKSPLEIESTETRLCSVSMRMELLAQIPFFEGLSEPELLEISRFFDEAGFKPGEFISFAGDPAKFFMIVADGRVKLLKHTSAGKNVLLDILTPGEFFGAVALSADDNYPNTAEALTQTCILRTSVSDFQKILTAHPPVVLKMLKITNRRLQAANERFKYISELSIEGRIAHLLLILGEKFGEKTTEGLLIQTPLGRTDVAAMTATTPETASRVMSQFQRDGLVEAGRQWVAILDQKALYKIAGMDSEVLEFKAD